jgi:hypothetical protein
MDSAAGRWLRALVVAAVALVALWLHVRIVIGHFSLGGDLLDSGWFAYIIASGDPWLHGPRSISDLSYYNYHVSPWLSGLSVLFRTLGIDGFTALAIHQGAAFALFAGSLVAIALHGRAPGLPLLLVTAVMVGLGSDLVFELASFPHFEATILAFCTLGAALLQRGQVAGALVAFALATLVREDGGLYALLFLAATAILRSPGVPRPLDILKSWELRAGLAAALVAVAMFWIKGQFFPAYPTFSSNFSGNNWDHVSVSFVLDRLGYVLSRPRQLITVAVTAALAFFSWRYLVVAVLISPLLVAHLLAVREIIAGFHVHYVIPLLVIWVGHVLTASYRLRAGALRRGEGLVLLGAAIACSTPLFLAVTQFPPIRDLASYRATAIEDLMAPPADLPALAAALQSAKQDGSCASYGVVSLLPDGFAPHEVIGAEAALPEECTDLFLSRGDNDYPALRPRAEAAGLVLRATIGERIDHYVRP